MHKFRRHLAVVIAITIVFLANTVNVAFSPIPLREVESAQDLSADRDSTLHPTQTNGGSYPGSKEMADGKPEDSFQNLWGLHSFDNDSRFDGIEKRGDLAWVDEDSAEIVIGVNNAKTAAYASLVNKISGSQGEIANTVLIRDKVVAVVADIPLTAISSFTEKVQKSGLARYAEPNMKCQAQFVPNDPHWSLQWGPQKIQADHAWNTTTGDSSVLVAVIDTGIDYDHPDLAGNYVELGYDWVNDDSDPMDDNGHGTHCAGIIAAVLNNAEGIAGTAQVSIMAEKGLDQYGWGFEDDLADAIIHAVNQGADILSNSWGGYGESMLIHDAVQYAHDNGALVIAAAGNEAWNKKLYPAAYDEVVAVTATDQDDNPAWFTNFGDWVEIAAPGVDIYSTLLDDTYDYKSGTSMACPHAAGVAALIWSQFPNPTRDWMRAQLKYTADDLGIPGFDDYYGHGRINARKAVEQAPPDHDLLISDWEKPAYIQPGDIASFTVTVLNFGANDEENVAGQLLVDGNMTDSVSISYLTNGTSTAVSLSWNPLMEGTYNVTLYVVPVADENITANNVVSALIDAQYLDVALFKNADPWGNPTNEQVLSLNGIAYGVFGSSDFGAIDVSDFTRLIIASDQDQAFYDAMNLYRWWFEDYVTDGGVLDIHAADWGWNGGQWVGTLPGGLTWYSYPANYVTIVDPTHPVVTVPNEITDYELDEWWLSVHGCFSYYQATAHVIIEEDSTGYPAYLQFYYGAGAIVASSQTLEWGYNHGNSLILENSLLYTPIKYPHELIVALEAPTFHEPNASSLLNATVYNSGLNNETDVELQLLIDGSILNNVTIPDLVNGTSYTMNYSWVPDTEAIYNVTAYAPPVPDENITINNIATKMVRVRSVIGHVVFEEAHLPTYTIGTNPAADVTGGYSEFANYLAHNGYTISTIDPGTIIDPGVLAPVEVLVIVAPQSGYSTSELDAIEAWVKNGGNLLLISDWIDFGLQARTIAARFNIDMASDGICDSDENVGYVLGPYYDGANLLIHQITAGVTRIEVYAGDGITSASADEIPLVITDSDGTAYWYYDGSQALGVSVMSVFDGGTAGSGRMIIMTDSNIWDSVHDVDGDGDVDFYDSDNEVLALNSINWFLLRYEHELTVFLETPKRLQPGETSVLNSTVYNIGLNNETDVEIQLLRNGTQVAKETVTELVNGTWYTINYSWTPTVEGIYNITAYTPPLPSENVTINNVATRMVYVYYIEVALISDYSELPVVTPILDSMGIGHVIYNDNNIYLYTENLDLLLNYKAVIFYTGHRRITSTEHSTLESYLFLGGNLLVTGFDCLVSDMLLADLVRSSSTGDSVGQPDLYVADETHPIMNGPYGSFPTAYHIDGLYGDCDMAEADATRNAVSVAELLDGHDRIIATEGLPGKVVFWNGMGTYDWTWNSDCETMFKNLIHWFTVRYQHDLVVSLEAPSFLEPGNSTLLNATVQNRGLKNETNVELYMLINGTVVKNMTISELQTGYSCTLSHLWTPTDEAAYNVTAYAPPVPDENATANNAISSIVRVCVPVEVLYDESHGNRNFLDPSDPINYGDAWGYTAWAKIVTEAGYRITKWLPEDGELTLPVLSHYDILVISMAREVFTAAEISAIQSWVHLGGSLFLIGEADNYGGDPERLNPIIREFGIEFDIFDYIYGNIISDLAVHPITEGIYQYEVSYCGVLILSPPAQWLGRNDTGRVTLACSEYGSGRAVVAADTNTFADNYGFQDPLSPIYEHSQTLSLNILDWLAPTYITISTDPSTGSPGTEVTVTGTKATANGTVSIYWDSTFMGNTTANAVGNFTYSLTVPLNAKVGAHEIVAIDITTDRPASAPFKVILLTLNPTEGPQGTKVTVSGAGFSPESRVTVTFNDMLIGYATVDSSGNFTFTFNIPLSSAETQIIKAWDAEDNYACATFTVVDVTPLEVQIDVGAMHFIGEIAEFYAQTNFEGQAVNATITNAVLYKPDGTTETLTAQRVTTGLYKISYTIPGDETGTYTLVVAANYITKTVRSNGTSFKCFLVSDTLTLMNNQVMEIKDGVAMVQTDLGFVRLNLTAVNATLENIFLKVIAINGTTATIQTTLGIVNGTVTGTITGDIATIVVPGLGRIETDISGLVGTQETSTLSQYLIIVIALIAAISSTLLAIFLRRLKTTKTE